MENIVVAAAMEEWSRHVEEPPGRGWQRIDLYIRSNLGLVWSWLTRPYTKNRQFAWCGAFAAWCYGVAGLRADVRRRHLASTYRLDRWSARTARRLYTPSQLRPGDIMVVGTKKRYGDHITIVRSVTPHYIDTVEGNAADGVFPDATVGEGVVRKRRPRTDFVFGVRPLPEDYDAVPVLHLTEAHA